MAEVCVAVGTLGAATDQSSCKTNLTLTNPLPHLLPPHHHQNSQFFTAKCTQHDITLINHPKQSMFNLWRAGLTRKFITCCRKTACASVSQASIYLWEMNKILERQSLQQRKLMMAMYFRVNSGDKAPFYTTMPLSFHGGWHACTTFSTALAKKI